MVVERFDDGNVSIDGDGDQIVHGRCAHPNINGQPCSAPNITENPESVEHLIGNAEGQNNKTNLWINVSLNWKKANLIITSISATASDKINSPVAVRSRRLIKTAAMTNALPPTTIITSMARSEINENIRKAPG
jgi:hypothetical protein